MIDVLYQTLILSGLIIFAVLFYLKRMASNYLRVLTEIIKTNELNEYDPVKFLENLPPFMKKLGIKKYSYFVFFLDTEYTKTENHSKNSIKKFVWAQDFTVYVEISTGELRWERSYMGTLLVETIFLLLKIDVNLHLKSATKALSEFNKINTFLSHDIKNLAQFINIMEHNLSKTVTDEKKDKLFEYLRSTAPSLKLRADRVLYSLAESAKEYLPQKDSVDPYEIALDIADILNVEIQHPDEPMQICIERKGLIIIFENIIKNFYDKSITEKGILMKMSAVKDDSKVTIRMSDTGSAIPNPEKIFEPFYSEKKGGLGIGLYHCRNIANNMQGKLWAENTPEGPVFILQIKLS
ncbi:MAG: hypothetical protein C0602_05385 [Denitrovibrio sp.]|nr:MAG: hypothetical protein C0602_05385 [Denitrovibrio sp.]